MAKVPFEDVVWWNKGGLGVLPGIVLNTRLEQQQDNSVVEVLTVLYANPRDIDKVIHHAADIGSPEWGIKPLSETNAFGWADTRDAFDAKKVTPQPPFDVKPDPVNSGSVADHMVKQGTMPGRAPLNELLPPGTYLSDRQTQGPGNEGSVADEDLSKPMNQQGQIVGATAPEDQGGGQVQAPSTDVNPQGAVIDNSVEVFADPDGRTIGVPDGAGGYDHIRDNPFVPGGNDHEGKPIR